MASPLLGEEAKNGMGTKLFCIIYKLLTRAYGTGLQLASQGGGLRPKVNIGLT